MIKPLNADRLVRTFDPANVPFETSAEMAEFNEIVGQQRALDALQFGTRIQDADYNIYALGPDGVGKNHLIHRLLAGESKRRPTPPDWCYVYNFRDPRRPSALMLPPGRGVAFCKEMEQLKDDVLTAIPAAFETEHYQAQIQNLERELIERRDDALNSLGEAALEQNAQLIHTPSGFGFAPLDNNNEVISPERFKELPEEDKQRIEDTINDLQKRLQKLVRQFPAWQKETHERVKELDRQIARSAVAHLISGIKETFQDLPEIKDYLDAMEQDIIEHAKDFRTADESSGIYGMGAKPHEAVLHRYQVNLIVDRSQHNSAPVVYQDLPSHGNLMGRIEYQSQMGALVTDFTLIRAGDLHRANGGYLLLDARHLLMQPFAWESLKRALRAGEIRIEPLERSLGLMSTVSLEPEAIPLKVKVVLMGDRRLYYLLNYYDPEFGEFFKVAADFEDALDISEESATAYAMQVGNIVKENDLLPIDRTGVARTIEHAVRLADDSSKLSLHLRSISDLLKEANYWAGEAGDQTISAQHVQTAIDRKIFRLDRVRERIYEAIERGIINIDMAGERVGQINGLSVLGLGEFSFGQPSRITATTRLGDGSVIDIERETELGGNIHSKGVLILSNFLASKFSADSPLSLSASLVFEQSYGKVDGDSASLAELCALLSSISGVPIKQNLAVTGSINQLGEVQAIGGVNQKIEGFFDVCSKSELSGQQGVIIPATNEANLMLRNDVVDAARQNRFDIYAVETVDQAIEILTGVEAGQRDESGAFPEGTLYWLVENRLFELANIRRSFNQSDVNSNGGEKSSD